MGGVDPQEEKLREVGKESSNVLKTPSKRKGTALFSLSTVDRTERENQLGARKFFLRVEIVMGDL